MAISITSAAPRHWRAISGPSEIWYGTFVNNHAADDAVAVDRGGERVRRGDGCWPTIASRSAASSCASTTRRSPDWQRQKVRNNDSLVIELRYGQVSMLLTGDTGEEVERALMPTLDLLPIVVLKSPHHGSAHLELAGVHRCDQAGAGR